MAIRHLARSIVMQTLFEWDVKEKDNTILESALKRNLDEFGPGLENVHFIEELLKGIANKQKLIDEIIEKAAPDWPIDKIAIVDRNVLQLGLYELVFGDREQVPPKVAINEAIELAKSYGGENSGRFINGVLGAIYREMGEPGKDDGPKKKKNIKPVDYEKLPIEKKAGAVVYAWHEDKLQFAMVHDVFGYWTLTKGGIDDIDDENAGVIREVKEEIGIDVNPIEKIGENEYIANHPQKGQIRKQVHYFLCEASYETLDLVKESGGLDDAKWFPMEDIANLTMYDDVTNLLAESIKKLTSEKK